MTTKPLRPVTPRDLDIIQRFDESDRHLALLALLAETSLPAIRDNTLAEIAALLPEANDAAPLVDGTGDTIWKDATAAERAPILERLATMFAEHIPPEVAPAAPATIEYADVTAPVTVRLAYPFVIDDTLVREVSLRPPRYGDVEGVLAGRIERSAMIAEMSGLSVDAINALRWPDAERVVGVAMDMAPQFAGV